MKEQEQVDLRGIRGKTVKRKEVLRRRRHFTALGFSAQWLDSVSQAYPTLWIPEVVDEHLKRLTQRGSSNPIKMVESFPEILGLAFDNIDAKLAGLSERGFGNPIKMVESFPAILGYTFDNIDAKLAGLRARGFDNPKKMVESSPAILGYTFDNIDRKLKLYGRLIRLYNLPFEPTQLMEKDSSLFSSKLDKVMVLSRVLRDYRVTPPTLNEALISRFLRHNLEDILVALARANSDEEIKALLSRVNRVRKEK